MFHQEDDQPIFAEWILGGERLEDTSNILRGSVPAHVSYWGHLTSHRIF